MARFLTYASEGAKLLSLMLALGLLVACMALFADGLTGRDLFMEGW